MSDYNQIALDDVAGQFETQGVEFEERREGHCSVYDPSDGKICMALISGVEAEVEPHQFVMARAWFDPETVLSIVRLLNPETSTPGDAYGFKTGSSSFWIDQGFLYHDSTAYYDDADREAALFIDNTDSDEFELHVCVFGEDLRGTHGHVECRARLTESERSEITAKLMRAINDVRFAGEQEEESSSFFEGVFRGLVGRD